MIRLHGYWRSTASYRVRIALNLKHALYEQVTHDLRIGQHDGPDYLRLNPQGLVPALEAGGHVLWQSMAIMEWIEETYPEPALLPSSSAGRAIVRAIAGEICCDIHPLNNLRVLQTLRNDLSASEADVSGWITRWITSRIWPARTNYPTIWRALLIWRQSDLSRLLPRPAGLFRAALRSRSRTFPAIRRVAANCTDLPAFQDAHPAAQPDAD